MKLVRHLLLQALRLEIKLVTYVYNTEYRRVIPAGFFCSLFPGRDSSSVYKTRLRFAGYAIRPHPHLHFGRLQSCARLIPGTLVLRSENDLVNRFPPRFDGMLTGHIYCSLYGFISGDAVPDLVSYIPNGREAEFKG